MKAKHVILTVAISFLSAFAAIYGYGKIAGKQSIYVTNDNTAKPIMVSGYANAPSIGSLDFTRAASLSTPAVVHVTTVTTSKQQPIDFFNPFRDFFGDNWGYNYGTPQPRMASGSGVIISADGYIVTNNHVVNDADEITVILNDNNKFTAKVIGTDPSTDLALLKIDEKNLPFIPFANSDSVMIGSWVMAVGNPFNLSSTVTAGIVSAKGRNINILEDNAAIESFIQTDAAVNPGNSGGALVNTSGQLIGINTAIASPNGTFAGYSFAVPSNLVYKVVNDLKEYGVVQRGFLGVNIRTIDSDLAKEKELKSLSGVYVENVLEGGAAEDAGLKSGDVIKSINGIAVNTSPQLQEVVAQFSPGDKLQIVYERNGSSKSTQVVLKNKNMNTELLKKGAVEVGALLGVEFEEVTAAEKKKLGIDGGVKISKINDGKIRKYTDMREGFIITRIDRTKVGKVEDINNILAEKRGGVMIEGVYPNYPGTYYYAFGL
ncbi:MAG: Do family serine endopeptidase [Chitinophagales bacterium]|nr:Do family serine endopeptidase [Chitinophagales bacterium]